MTRTILSFSLFIGLLGLQSCSSKKERGRQIIDLMNEYNRDSLVAITADDFVLKYVAYPEAEVGKKEFIKSFVDNSKPLHSKYSIRKTINKKNPFTYEVEDHNDYVTYLGIPPQVTVLGIYMNKDGKMEKIILDTLPGYEKAQDDFRDKHRAFDKWVKEYYPGESTGMFFDIGSPVYAERLKEYAKMMRK